MVDNYAIADQFSLLSKLMDIHGENSFKSKSYSSAAFTIEKLSEPLAQMSEAQFSRLRGIGESVGKKITEFLQTGELRALQELIQQTPSGVLEMMHIKGLGPKKINIIWKEMNIDTIEELEKACRENRIATKKGFGEKTEQKILESISFARGSKGQFLYKQVEDFALALQNKLESKFAGEQIMLTGEFRRQMETISKLEWITTVPVEKLKAYLVTDDVEVLASPGETLSLRAADQLELLFHSTTPPQFARKLFQTSSSEEFLSAWQNSPEKTEFESEEDIFRQAGSNYIPPFLRERSSIIERAKLERFDNLVQTGSIKGLIHSHSNWSDGAYTIEEMAEELIRQGFEYMVISDHSKAAYYANGLSEQRIREQHQYIDSLNKKIAPFRIFKSIECDILGDGSLDYDNATLSTFDLVITSIHSNLDMDEEKAMMRLMGAITNPYTTILGHMTGRLLLKRKGYPVDHRAIIDACVKHHVVIEINASPSRLDMDWRWIDYAMEKGLLLSINPDAHALEEFPYLKYGTLVAQKGGLTAARNLSSFSLAEFENYLADTRKKKLAISNG
ncbi:helix-hairpin-helix domain-containing protein [Flavisolibacter nicotianae]|uniref:helix-hairpin-helix domain-containing protein n=1 Tax=Flavisolibacter nicotianae TaxID=2364882 RepID=UPI000EB10685|nr:helix-hairpin-helix domain-containing protein [Flavisolibacter nicotianae]